MIPILPIGSLTFACKSYGPFLWCQGRPRRIRYLRISVGSEISSAAKKVTTFQAEEQNFRDKKKKKNNKLYKSKKVPLREGPNDKSFTTYVKNCSYDEIM